MNQTSIWAAQQILQHPDATAEDIARAREILTAAVDQNLPSTLQLGIPFTDKRLDTRLPIPKELAAGLVGAGQTVNSLAQTGKQLYNAARGDTAANADQAATQQDEARLYGQLESARPYSTFAGQVAGNMVPYLGVSGGLAKLGLTGRAIPGLTNALLSGGITGAAEYAPSEGQHAAQALTGALGAGAGDVAGRVLGRLVQPFQDKNLASRYADALAAREAIPGLTIPTMQQLNSGAGQLAEAAAMRLPGVAGLATDLGQANKEAIARAVNKTMGETGDTVFLGVKGAPKEANIGSAMTNIGARIDESLTDKAVMFGSKGFRQFNNLVEDMNTPKTGLSREGLKKFNEGAELVRDKLDPSTPHKGIITGKSYQSLRQELRGLIDDTAGNAQEALVKLRNIVDKEASGSIGPKAAKQFQEGNAQWSAMMQAQRGIDSGATPGYVRPLGLAKATQPDLAAIARYGQNFRPYPDSGTAARALWQDALMNPMTLGTGIGGLGGLGLQNGQVSWDPRYALLGLGLGGLAQAGMRGSLRGTGADTFAKWGMSPTRTAIRKGLPVAGGLLGASATERLYDPYANQ